MHFPPRFFLFAAVCTVYKVIFFSYFVIGSRREITGPVSGPSFAEDVRIGEEISFESWEFVNATPDRIKVISECPESNFSFVDLFPGVDVVEEVLVIGVLLIPLDVVIVAEIVAH